MKKLHCQFTDGTSAVLYMKDDMFWGSQLATLLGLPLSKPVKWADRGIEHVDEAIQYTDPGYMPRFYLNTEMGLMRLKLAAAKSLLTQPAPVTDREIHDLLGHRLVGEDSKVADLNDYADRLLSVLECLHDGGGWDGVDATLEEMVADAQALGIRATVKPPQEPAWSLTPPTNFKVTRAMAEVMRAFPDSKVDSVVYSPRGMWQYMDEDGIACDFSRGNYDAQALNDAADSLDGHPSVFFVVWE